MQAQNDLDKALIEYRASLAICERLVAEDPASTVWQRELMVSYFKVGEILQAQDDLARALTEYRAALAVAERLMASDPTNTGWQHDLAMIHERVGSVLQAQGNLGGAMESYRASLAILERLVAGDSSNALWQSDLWVACCCIADVLGHLGDPTAVEWWQRAYDILSSMKRAGMYISPADEQYYQQLRQKLRQ